MGLNPEPGLPLPAHVGIIMDGNGRWARKAGLNRLRGHAAGIEAVRDTVTAAAEWGIPHLTLYAFSAENWERPRAEIQGLMTFLTRFLRSELDLMKENSILLRGIGRLDDLPGEARKALDEAETATASGEGTILRLALSYGGRQEIVDAAQRMASDIRSGVLDPADVGAESLAARFYDPSMPDLDLVIRTAGEKRLSNFLLWQASYAEFHFPQVLWPDFRREHFLKALQDFQSRVRRYGRVPEEAPEA